MYGATKYRSLAVKLPFSGFYFFEWSSTAFEIAVSLFLCAKVDFVCCWFVVQNRKLPSENGNLLLRFEELNSNIILSLPIDRIECSVLNSHSDSWVVCLFKSVLVPLRPVVGLRPPSKIPSFYLTITTESLSVLSQNTTSEGVLSLCWCSLTPTLTTSIGIW